MNNVNDPRWTEEYEGFFESNPDSCRSCHSANLEGTRLSHTATDRTFLVDDNGNEIIIWQKQPKSVARCVMNSHKLPHNQIKPRDAIAPRSACVYLFPSFTSDELAI